MPVKEVERSKEEKLTEEKNIVDMKEAVAKGIVDNIDLSEDSFKKGKEQEKEEKKKEVKPEKEEQEESEDEETEEETEQEEQGEGEEQEEQEEEISEEDDLVPKSKVEKMLGRQEKRIADLTKRIKISEASAAKQAETKDPEVARLEAMSPEKLQTLKRNCRIQQAKESDDEKINQLVDLELKIDDAIRTTPQRFQNKQIELFNRKAEEISTDPDIEDVEKAAPKILESAKKIYNDSPELHKIKQGQALALELAAEHYKAISKISSGKSNVKKLKTDIKKLKRKTTLDGNKVRGEKKNIHLENLRKKAFRGGDLSDKANLVKNDPRFNVDSLIPDEFKERGS